MTAWFKDNFKWPSLVVWGTSFALVYLMPPAWLRVLPGMKSGWSSSCARQQRFIPGRSGMHNPSKPDLQRQLRDSFQWPGLVVMGASFVLVYMISPAWLRTVPGMDTALAFLLHQLPGVRRYVDVSQMPDLASVYFPLMALIAPLMGWEVMLHKNPERWFNSFWRRPLKNCFITVFVMALAVGFFWLAYWEGGAENDSLSVRNSKLYLALLGPAYAGGAASLALALALRSLRSFIFMEGKK